MTEDYAPIPVQLHMTEDDFYGLIDTSMQWGVWEIRDIEDGRYETVDEDRDTVSLEWRHEHHIMDRSSLILAKSYLRALGEAFECLWDTAALPEDDEPEETAEKWPPFRLLTNFGPEWGNSIDCEWCKLPSGHHWEDCPFYPVLIEQHPGMDLPMPLAWKNRVTATLPKRARPDAD